jgi:phosphoglycerate kinase
MISFDTIRDVVIANKTVLVRCDLNVPFSFTIPKNSDGGGNYVNVATSESNTLNNKTQPVIDIEYTEVTKEGGEIKNSYNNLNCGEFKILDYSRIQSCTQTIKYLVAGGAKVILCSHLGRPKDNQNTLENSLQHLVRPLQLILGTTVYFASDCISPQIPQLIKQMQYGEVLLLENLRFHKEEEQNDEQFARLLTRDINIYVNEAFSCSHRKHTSIYAAAQLVRPVAGLNLAQEVSHLQKITHNLGGNIMSIIGGKKVDTKIDILKKLAAISKYLVLGGGMANTFLLHNGINIGASFAEAGVKEIVYEIAQIAKTNNCEIILPIDFITSDKQQVGEIEQQQIICDIGEKTINLIKQKMQQCNTVICNGPLGIYEQGFSCGTGSIINEIASITSIAGGGDIIACINASGRINDLSFVSNAGGAFLEFISTDGHLPGIDILVSRSLQFQK